MRLQLRLIMVDAVLRLLERHVRELALEARVVDDAGHPLQMFLKTAGDGAGLGGELRVEIVEAALQRALQKAAPVVAGARGHIVGRHVRRGAARRAQTRGEAAGQIQQYLGHEVAGVAQRQPALILGLLDQLVVCFLQEIFKVDQMLEISHRKSSRCVISQGGRGVSQSELRKKGAVPVQFTIL